MSRRSNIRKRIRQKRNRSSRKLAAPISQVTGQEQMALQTPVRSDFRRCSTAALIEEIQRRPEAKAFLAAIAEQEARDSSALKAI
jgi:hypothetical protein